MAVAPYLRPPTTATDVHSAGLQARHVGDQVTHVTASTAQLNTWASNFSQLRTELDGYEDMATAAAAVDPGAAQRRGVGQLIGFQVGTLLRMALPLVAQYGPNPPTTPIPGSEHVQLMGRYFLELTVLKVDEVPFDDARARLGALADRLQDTATRWAAAGVDQAEVEQLATESRELAAKTQAAAQ